MKNLLKNTINRTLSDCRSDTINAETIIGVVGVQNIDKALEILREWEESGILDIVSTLSEKSKGSFLKMHSYIEKKSPIPGFLNWEK